MSCARNRELQARRGRSGWFLLLLTLLVAVVAAAAFQDLMLGGVIAIAMVINLMVAAIAGSLLPSVLGAMKIDPAIAGGVVLTTVTDVVGILAFIGLASFILLGH